MKILLIGSGAREHALAWHFAQSPNLDALFVSPGNPGTATCGTNVVIDIADHAAVLEFCRLMRVDLCVVGPEAPLVAGLADSLEAGGIEVFGPSRAAAQLEGSKAFTKALCREIGLPTAGYAVFTDAAAAKVHIRSGPLPVVVKADGLAAGKGVVVAHSLEAAEMAVDGLAATGATMVVEAFLEGEEVSFFALSDGKHVVACGSARDYKRVGDGDRGPNTGGMGAVSPAPALTPELEAQVMAEIVRPTVAAMHARGTPFRGVLFAGLMLTAEGPKLIEYNVRFGDPECQALMARLDEDLIPRLRACAQGRLADGGPIRFKPQAAVTVVMAARGYPAAPESGSRIRRLDRAAAHEGVTIFHAGTRMRDSELLADGGRVLSVCAVGDTAQHARARAYAAIDDIDWTEGFCRRDIGVPPGPH